MAIRYSLLGALAVLSLLAACGEEESGPIAVSAIGAPPSLSNPNLKSLDPPSAFLLESAAQGLVRFNAAGEIEPALAQRWTVSNDGLHYTFRLARLTWPDGRPITSDQVVARLKAASASSSRNSLKPILGAIDQVQPMIAEVLEIGLKSPRPNFLQTLAQPEMAILRGGQGSGPYDLSPQSDRSVLLTPRKPAEEEEDMPVDRGPPLLLRGERSAMAVARFEAGAADLVIGGTLGDLAIARAADQPGARLVFDPVGGMLGLAFAHRDGPLTNPDIREALSMVLDRAAIVQAFAIPNWQPRETLLPPGIVDQPQPAAPGWAPSLALRRQEAAGAIASAGAPVTIHVAMPDGPGYRLLFAYLRRDWRAIGVTAERVAMNQRADLRLVDEVAPTNIATWYLRHFACGSNSVCDSSVDEMLAAARLAPNAAVRRDQLAKADRQLTDLSFYVPIASPVRWSLVSQRLNGFRANAFARHPAGELIRAAP
ncbi:MAG: ABC transporter substrate-binding protein [Allosphingosinicella sp.]